MKKILLAGLLLGITPAFAAEPIEGQWLTPKGQTVSIAACDAGYCLTRPNGMALGAVTGTNGRYEGEIVNPENGKTNAVKIEVAAEGLTLSGCVGPICASRTWTRANP